MNQINFLSKTFLPAGVVDLGVSVVVVVVVVVVDDDVVAVVVVVDAGGCA